MQGATKRRLIPIACVRRSSSRTFRIDTLSAGIGHPLVAKETDQPIRLSTGAPLRRRHLLSAFTGLLSPLPWNRCPRCTGFRTGKVVSSPLPVIQRGEGRRNSEAS